MSVRGCESDLVIHEPSNGEDTTSERRRRGGPDLRAEIRKLLAETLATDDVHVADMDGRDEVHIAETNRRDVPHDEVRREQGGSDQELVTIREWLESRDIIGQTRGLSWDRWAAATTKPSHQLRSNRKPRTARWPISL